MSGQPPWRQAPDGGWYWTAEDPLPNSPGDGPGKPGKDGQEKKSTLREWISTTAGATTAVVALVGLLAGGAVVIIKIISPPPNSSQSTGPTSPNTRPSPPHLKSSLLSSGIVSSTATVTSSGTDLSQLKAICGGPRTGATATAFEWIQDQQGCVSLRGGSLWDVRVMRRGRVR
jgi:hypothetical protein